MNIANLGETTSKILHLASMSDTTDRSGETTLPTASDSRVGLSTGTLAGVGVGIALAVLVLVFLAFIAFRIRKISRQDILAKNISQLQVYCPSVQAPPIYKPLNYIPPVNIRHVDSSPVLSDAGKNIKELSLKRVLGLDDTSYLARLPKQYGWFTARVFYTV